MQDIPLLNFSELYYTILLYEERQSRRENQRIFQLLLDVVRMIWPLFL